jgi:hypothetical protein
MKICPVCNSGMIKVFIERILNKYNVQYYHCQNCDLLQTEEPYWLDEAYSDSIAISDTGIIMRNISQAIKLVSLLFLKFSYKNCYADIAGGYGILTRLMRDFGFDFYWSDKYSPNLVARGFETEKNNTEIYSAITAFEVIEHIHNPILFIKNNLKNFQCDTLIFSTILYEENKIPDKNWWYYSFNTGQHISFYSKKTLNLIAITLNMKYLNIGGFHILTKRNIHINIIDKFLVNSIVFTLLVRKILKSKTLADKINLEKNVS